MNSIKAMYNVKLSKKQFTRNKKTLNKEMASAKQSKYSKDLEDCEKFNEIFANYFDFIKCFGSDSICSYFKVLDLNKLEACIDTDPYIIIKILNESFRSDGISCSAFKQEYRRFVSLVHPNIMSTRGFDQKNNYCFLKMENLRGELLNDAIHLHHYNNPMPAKKSLSIIHDIASALDFAHSKEVFHGDLNPSNVLLSHSGVVKLIDLGLASLFVANENKSPQLRSQQLKLNSSYASPQTLTDHTIDAQDDVFSLSCTAYEILTGCHPYNYQLSTEALEQDLKVKWHKQLSYKQWQALRRGLTFDKKERTQNIRALITELNEEIISKETVKPAAALAASIVCGMLVGQNLFHDDKKSPLPPPKNYQTTSRHHHFDRLKNLSELEPSYGEKIKTAQIKPNGISKEPNLEQASLASNGAISQPEKKIRKTEEQTHSVTKPKNLIVASNLSKDNKSNNEPLFPKKRSTTNNFSKQTQPPIRTNKKPIINKHLENIPNSKKTQNKSVIEKSINNTKINTKISSKPFPQDLLLTKTESKTTELNENLLKIDSKITKLASNEPSKKEKKQVHQQIIHSVLANQIDITNETNLLLPDVKNSTQNNNSINDSKQQNVKTEHQESPQIKAFATF